MGKKVSQSSVKISKNEKQLNSLIKVLRPKVYITDTSSFKSLVQELTGNGKSSITNSQQPMKPDAVENLPIIDTNKDRQDPESSMEVSIASVDSSELCDQVVLAEESNQLCSQVYLDDTTFEDSTPNQEVDLLAYQDLESWLLEIDQPYPAFYNFHAQIEQEVSIFDYELSGLI